MEMKANGDKAMTLAIETSRHSGKLLEMADPSKGNKLDMTTARTTAVIRISIALPAAAMTKGKAPAAMTGTVAPRRAEGSRHSCRDP
jgi:hypothetical protein